MSCLPMLLWVALAQIETFEPETYEEAKEGTGATAARSRLGSSQPVTGVRPPQRDTLEDLLSEAPGVTLFGKNGEGSTQIVSIRSVHFARTEVIIDHIPLIGPDRGPVDLGLIPLHGLTGVEIYRGSSPLRFGSGSIGSLIRLAPEPVTEQKIWAEALAGSFGLIKTRALAEGLAGDFSGLVSGGFTQADNHFRYVDKSGTLETEADDNIRERANADFEQGHVFSKVSWEKGQHKLDLLAMFVHRWQGLPGPALTPSDRSRQIRSRVLSALGYSATDVWFDVPVEGWVSVSFGYDRDQVRDPEAEIGLEANDRDDTYWSLNSRAGLSFEPSPGWKEGTFLIRAVGNFLYDEIHPKDFLRDSPIIHSHRLTLVGGVEGALFMPIDGMPLEIEASISGQLSHTRLRSGEAQESQNRTVDHRNLRVAGELEVLPGWFILGTFAEGSRLPTTLEFFGNQSTVVGNVELLPESSTSLEAGTRVETSFSGFELNSEARVFRLGLDDIILGQLNAERNIVFENERSALTWGLEAILHCKVFRLIQTRTAITYLHARLQFQSSEQTQPLAPQWRLYHRTEIDLPIKGIISGLAAYAEVEHRSGFFDDAANTLSQPAYTAAHTGASVRLWEDRITAFALTRNLFDELGSNLLSFPRPGRAFELGLRLGVAL